MWPRSDDQPRACSVPGHEDTVGRRGFQPRARQCRTIRRRASAWRAAHSSVRCWHTAHAARATVFSALVRSAPDERTGRTSPRSSDAYLVAVTICTGPGHARRPPPSEAASVVAVHGCRRDQYKPSSRSTTMITTMAPMMYRIEYMSVAPDDDGDG